MSEINFAQRHIPFYCVFYCQEKCMATMRTIEFTLSSIFTVITVGISLYHITLHMLNFNNPFFQSKIIVIMFMPAFYCLMNMGAFYLPNYGSYFGLTRDFYETIFIFTFFSLIFSYLAYDRQNDKLEDKKVYVKIIKESDVKQIPHFWPFNIWQKPYQFTHWKKAKYFTYRCKKFVLQYIIIKLAMNIVMYLMYGNQQLRIIAPEAQMTYNIISQTITWITGISSCMSLQAMGMFYIALQKPLAPYQPLLKFLSINVTINFTFWQHIVISNLQNTVYECYDQSAPSFNSNTVIPSLENTIICLEMLVVAFASGMAYSYENYKIPKFRKIGSFIYVLHDVIKTFQNDFRLIKPKKFGFEQKQNKEIQLHEIKWQHRESAFVKPVMVKSIDDIYIENYF